MSYEKNIHFCWLGIFLKAKNPGGCPLPAHLPYMFKLGNYNFTLKKLIFKKLDFCTSFWKKYNDGNFSCKSDKLHESIRVVVVLQ